MNKYDVVIIGAGNGGLMASCTLAKAGRKVLLIEQHNLPGGCATSFRRGRFEFEVSLHELGGEGTSCRPCGVQKRLEDVGGNLDFYGIPDAFRLITKGRDGQPIDISMPTDIALFLDKIEEAVPGSRKSVEDFFALADESEQALGAIACGKCTCQKDIEAMFPNYAKVIGMTVNDVLNMLDIPPRAQDILNTYWCYLGVDTNRLTFEHYASCSASYIKYGASIPNMTSHGLSTAFLEAFRAHGGEVWFNTKALKIIFNKGRASGVSTTSGDVLCNYVIANMNPNTLYSKLVPKDMIPSYELKLANARKLSTRTFGVYLGLDKSAEELGLNDYSYFIMDSADSVKTYEDMKSFNNNSFFVALCYNVANPHFSPKGTCVLSLTSMYSEDIWADISIQDYHKKKNAIALKMINEFEEKTGIHIIDSIEEITTASPWTFARYLGTPEGAVYGYETNQWDGIVPRIIKYKNAHPIEGLYFCGAADLMGDGYGPSYDSGQAAAQCVLNEISRKEKE